MKHSSFHAKFDSSVTCTGLDFIARSLVLMEANGTHISPEAVTGNMSSEQKAILLARIAFHRKQTATILDNELDEDRT